MKRNFSKTSYREKVDKVEKKANIPVASQKDKGSGRIRSMVDDLEEEYEELDPKLLRLLKTKK